MLFTPRMKSLNSHISIVTHNIVFRNGTAVVIRKLAERKRQSNVASNKPGRCRTEKGMSYAKKEMNYVGASNAVWYPFGKPGDFLWRENRPVSACWGEPQIPHNAPLVRLRILRTLLFLHSCSLCPTGLSFVSSHTYMTASRFWTRAVYLCIFGYMRTLPGCLLSMALYAGTSIPT